MKLVVGLGNPGRQYVGTRHNIGFEALDALAVRLGWIARSDDYERLARQNFEGLMLDGLANLSGGASEKLVLLKPVTYMNLSGRSVQSAKAFYQLTSADLMVVLDDMALPAGRIRIRASGSDGGHNGLRDIQQLLGTSKYPRLRLGIDAPPPMIPGRDYVLGRFTEAQRKALAPAIDKAASAILTWLEKGIDQAMSLYNAPDDTERKD